MVEIAITGIGQPAGEDPGPAVVIAALGAQQQQCFDAAVDGLAHQHHGC